ncbi:MAG: response regulator [bacterium]
MDVLIVDDEKDILRSLKTFLEMEGYHVTTTDNSTDAIERFERNGYNIVLLDINMPEIDGLELLERILSIDYHTEVIMMTGFNSLDKVFEARELGASEYMLKPFDDMDSVGEIAGHARDRVKRWNRAFEQGLLESSNA